MFLRQRPIRNGKQKTVSEWLSPTVTNARCLGDSIEAHANGGADTTSEALGVINNFNGLITSQKQDLLNFLRSL